MSAILTIAHALLAVWWLWLILGVGMWLAWLGERVARS